MSAFAPGLLLRSPHVQTFFAGLPVLFATPGDALRKHLVIPLADGDALHALSLFHPQGTRRTALLVHGLGGSSASAYVQRAARALYDAGFHVVSLDLRGAGAGAGYAKKLYHAGLTGDLRAAVTHVLLDRRVEDLFVIGFSLGGQTALLCAAEWGSTPPERVRGVVASCSPVDLRAASEKIERLRARPYLRYVLRSLIDGALALKRRVPHAVIASARELEELKTIRAYDEQVIAPMHGFASADAYYAACSSGPRLGDVRMPTFALMTKDDPMVPAATVAPWLERASPAVRVLWSERGGHLGFVDGLGEGLWKSWGNERLVSIVRGDLTG